MAQLSAAQRVFAIPELLDSVLQCTDCEWNEDVRCFQHDRGTLRSASLVARSWRHFAQPLLFSVIVVKWESTLQGGLQQIELVGTALHSRPSLRQNVRAISAPLSPLGTLALWFSNDNGGSPQFPRLTNLCVGCIVISRHPSIPPDLNHLRHLTLRRSDYDDLYLASRLMPMLTSLDLNGHDGDEDAAHESMLADAPWPLTRFTFEPDDEAEAQPTTLRYLLAPATKLRELKLRNVFIVEAVAALEQMGTSLNTLHLALAPEDGVANTDEGGAIAGMLRHIPSAVTSLHLGTDDGLLCGPSTLGALAASLDHLVKLQHLRIYESRFNLESVMPSLRAIEEVCRMRSIIFEVCQSTARS